MELAVSLQSPGYRCQGFLANCQWLEFRGYKSRVFPDYPECSRCRSWLMLVSARAADASRRLAEVIAMPHRWAPQSAKQIT